MTIIESLSLTPDVERYRRAAFELYEAECALHAARQSGVDAWTGAAGDHLHAAVACYEAARAALAAAEALTGQR